MSYGVHYAQIAHDRHEWFERLRETGCDSMAKIAQREASHAKRLANTAARWDEMAVRKANEQTDHLTVVEGE